MCVITERDSLICGHTFSHTVPCSKEAQSHHQRQKQQDQQQRQQQQQKTGKRLLSWFRGDTAAPTEAVEKAKCEKTVDAHTHYEICYDCARTWRLQGYTMLEAQDKYLAYRKKYNYLGELTSYVQGYKEPTLFREGELPQSQEHNRTGHEERWAWRKERGKGKAFQGEYEEQYEEEYEEEYEEKDEEEYEEKDEGEGKEEYQEENRKNIKEGKRKEKEKKNEGEKEKKEIKKREKEREKERETKNIQETELRSGSPSSNASNDTGVTRWPSFVKKDPKKTAAEKKPIAFPRAKGFSASHRYPSREGVSPKDTFDIGEQSLNHHMNNRPPRKERRFDPHRFDFDPSFVNVDLDLDLDLDKPLPQPDRDTPDRENPDRENLDRGSPLNKYYPGFI